MKKILFLTVLLFFTINSSNLMADGLDSQFKAWSVFTSKQDGEKICYITSSPIKTSGNWKKRSEPYMLITYRGQGIAEVSASSGYPYKKDSTVMIKVDKKKAYEMFTSKETPKIAWADGVAQDKKIVKAMMRGNKNTVKGTSHVGTWSLDTYSLMGISKAYKRMQSLCKGK